MRKEGCGASCLSACMMNEGNDQRFPVREIRWKSAEAFNEARAAHIK
jgi:hypothetical protein